MQKMKTFHEEAAGQFWTLHLFIESKHDDRWAVSSRKPVVRFFQLYLGSKCKPYVISRIWTEDLWSDMPTLYH